MIQAVIQQKVKYSFKKPNKKEINLCNSNRKLKELFPKLKFISFRKGLIKTLKDETIL